MTTTSATLTQAAKTGKPTTDDAKKATVDYEAFLKLLTAQLRNQDPLAPMDATQFMTQLAQLSTVEQSMKTNDTLTQVLDTLKSSGMRMDMAFLGRKVEATSNTIALANGKGELAYAIAGTPASVKVEVLDKDGKAISSSAGSTQAGRQTFSWNGRMTNGSTAPDGSYTVRITAKDKEGNALDSASVITDTVAEVRNVDGATQFVLKSGATVDANAILSAS